MQALLLYINIMKLFLLLSLFCATVFANDSTAIDDSLAQEQLDTNKSHTLTNIDIFGEIGVGSMFILWDNIEIDLDVKKNIQEKSFATNHFYMQNIDREQFEQERVLILFEDQKTKFFRLFPDLSDEEDH